MMRKFPKSKREPKQKIATGPVAKGVAMSDPALSNSLADLAARIRKEHEAASIAMRRTVEHAMAAGDLLLEAKTQLKHGQWLPWLKGNCALSDRTARLYMSLAKGRSTVEAEIGNVADLTVRRAVALVTEANATAEAFELRMRPVPNWLSWRSSSSW
jgi:hypothetical protein